MSEWVNEWMGLVKACVNVWKKKNVDEWKNGWTKDKMDEWVNEWMKEQMKKTKEIVNRWDD